MSQRFEGKNVDEALTAAAEALKCERYQLTYHVLLEKRGFLGGVKRVVLEAEVNTSATDEPAAPPPQADAQRTVDSRPMRTEARRERGGGGGGGRGAGGRGGAG